MSEPQWLKSVKKPQKESVCQILGFGVSFYKHFIIFHWILIKKSLCCEKSALFN